MKTKYTLLFCLVASICFSQQNICGEIEYTLTKNITYFYQEHFKMTFNDSVSFSEEVKFKKRSGELEKENIKGMLTHKIREGRKDEPSFYYNKNDEFYFSEVWEKTSIIVKEDDFDWNWKLHKETKKIGDFNCQKATIKFRGRNYTAWFTNEIPIRYGPWKFQGLSGLILEVYDDDYFLHIVTNSVKINENENCSILFEEEKLKDALSIEEYLEKRTELTKAKFARISSKLPKGSKPLILDENCEGCNSSRIEIFNEDK